MCNRPEMTFEKPNHKLGPWKRQCKLLSLKGVVPILTCVFYTLNWLTLTPETHFAQFYLKVSFYFLSWAKNKYVTLGMRLLWKYIRKSKLVYQLICTVSAITSKVKWIWSWNFGVIMRKIWAFIWHQKKYYFRLSPGGWEYDRHKGL